jgi:hypothetical protein
MLSSDLVTQVVTPKRLTKFQIFAKCLASAVEYQCGSLNNTKPEPYCATSFSVMFLNLITTVTRYHITQRSKRMEDVKETNYKPSISYAYKGNWVI